MYKFFKKKKKIDNSKSICKICNLSKNKRYIYNNHNDNNNYCISCLKEQFFFNRYSICENCLYNFYDKFNSIMVLMYDNNNNTINLCNECFKNEYLYNLDKDNYYNMNCDNSPDNDLSNYDISDNINY